MQLQPATLLQGRYRIVALIAKGGMGAVYRAADERLGSTVALKQTLMSDPALMAAFEREARLLAGLQHPALPVVSDHFSEGGGQFLVMQFIPGDDLATLLRRRGGPFALAEALAWADSLLDALAYLHGQRPPIIHRDLKPQNLKLTARGEIVLLDFGLAKGLAGSGDDTSPSLFGYTPQYAPLEQIQGSGTDARSDLYALGATFYELLTGTPPPDALTRAAAAVRGEPDPLRPALEVRPQIPAPVSHLLGQALALNPELRPLSAAVMRAALASCTQAQAAAAPAEASHQGGSAATGPTIALATAAPGGAQPVAVAAPGGAQPISAPGAPARSRLLLLAFALAAALVFIALAAVSCFAGPGGSASPTSAGVFGAATTTPPAPSGPGASFADPARYGAPGELGPLRLRVLSTQRGDEAWRAMYRANQFNDPPLPGYEYYLVQLELEASGAMPELYPRLAGERRVFYAPSGVSPAPLPEALEPRQSVTAWVPYLVAVDEGDLVLHVDTILSEPDYPPLYLAAEAGARLPTDPAIAQIDPNEAGASHREPAPLGETAIMEDYEAAVLETRRGPEVLAALVERYDGVERPRQGYEYALVLVRVRYIGDGAVVGWASIGPSNIDTVLTSATDPKAEAIDHPGVYILPDKLPELDVNLLPGGQIEGWAVVELPVGEEAVALVFSPGFDVNKLNTRYFALN